MMFEGRYNSKRRLQTTSCRSYCRVWIRSKFQKELYHAMVAISRCDDEWRCRWNSLFQERLILAYQRLCGANVTTRSCNRQNSSLWPYDLSWPRLASWWKSISMIEAWQRRLVIRNGETNAVKSPVEGLKSMPSSRSKDTKRSMLSQVARHRNHGGQATLE